MIALSLDQLSIYIWLWLTDRKHFDLSLPKIFFGGITRTAIWSNFELSVKSYPRFYWFCFSSLCDWSRKLTPLSQPIKCKTKTNHDQERFLSCHDLVTRVFPRFWQFFLTSSSHWFSKGSSHGTVMIILVLVLHQSIEKRSKLHRKCYSWTHVFCVCFAEYTGCVLLHVGLCSVATCCFSCPWTSVGYCLWIVSTQMFAVC